MADQGRLAGAIGTNHSDELTGGNLCGDIIEGWRLIGKELFCDAIDDDKLTAHLNLRSIFCRILPSIQRQLDGHRHALTKALVGIVGIDAQAVDKVCAELCSFYSFRCEFGDGRDESYLSTNKGPSWCRCISWRAFRDRSDPAEARPQRHAPIRD